MLPLCSDGDVSFSGAGLLVAVLSIFCSALFQIWVGSKQKLLELGSLQLVHQYAPYSALLLGVIIPFAEPVGFLNATPDTLLGFNYTWVAIVGIILSSALGVVVSLSTFLAIGATSPVTFNIAGHTKVRVRIDCRTIFSLCSFCLEALTNQFFLLPFRWFQLSCLGKGLPSPFFLSFAFV